LAVQCLDCRAVGLAVTLQVVLPGLDQAAAEVLVAEADSVCPYPHAVRGNIAVKIEVASAA